MLEAEIADLIKDKFSLSGQPDDWDRQRAAWDQTSATQRRTDATHEADDSALDPNGACHERPARNADVKVYDPEKLAGLASSSAQMRHPVIVGLLLLAALGIAGLGAWSSNHFVQAVPSSIPIDQKLLLSIPPGRFPPSLQAQPSHLGKGCQARQRTTKSMIL
jgi:hypothetical protein